MTSSHTGRDPGDAADDGDDDDTLSAAGSLPEDHNHRHIAMVGPAWDPYEDRPDERRLALAPLLEHEGGGLHRAPLGLATGSGVDKLNFLMELDKPQEVVQALAPEEFVFLVRDIGLHDSAELLSFASPRQLQACVDLDAWRGDELDGERFLRWLAVARSESTEVADRFVASQEDGLLCLLLAQHLKVVPVHDDMEAEIPDDVDVFDTPDGAFKLYGDPDSGDLTALREVVAALYRIDLLRARAVIRSVHWELQAQLEDDLVHLRDARLADLGMMGRDEALEIYGYRDPHALAASLHDSWRGTVPTQHGEQGVRPYLPLPDDARLGLALRDQEAEGSFLRAVFARLPAADQERVRTGLTRLTYRIQCARAEHPSLSEELPRWSRHALRTLAMGLQHLSRDDTAYAALLLSNLPADDLFRAGHSLVVIETHKARRLRKALGGDAGIDLLEPLDQAVVRGLLLAHPMVTVAEQRRPFESLGELEAVGRRLTTLALQVQWMAHLAGGELSVLWTGLPARTRPRLTTLFNTSMAWQILSGTAQLRPLGAGQVRELLDMVLQGDRVAPAIRAALTGAVLADAALSDAQAGALTEFVGESLDRLAAELGGLAQAIDIDLRFVGDALWVTEDLPS